ncbi:MAG TPA: glycosyl hydrolase [Chitinophagaceae bacterium]|nr:glycosyl hydrolase [Chitinophagaceae bacterium]
MLKRIHFAKSILFSFSLVILTGLNSKIFSQRSLESNFLNPPIENRPLAFWPWLNGYVDTNKMVYELNEMKNKGMRGALIWDVGALADPGKIIPAGPAFLGTESLKYISIALKTGKKLGLDLGLIASSSWNAGGPWISEEDASKQLLSTSQVITGPSKETILIGIPHDERGEVKTYSLITSVSFPYSDANEIDYSRNGCIKLDSFITKDKKYIDWKVPDGKWVVVSFFMCNTGQKLECPSPNSSGLVIDHLSKAATRKHFDTILTRLNNIPASENNLKFLEVDSYEVWPAKDWTPGLIQEFKRRYRYDPIPLLPLLLGYKSKDSINGNRFIADYNRLISDLIIENHFAQSVQIAGRKNIQMLAEAGHGGSARVDPLKGLGNSNIPMGEFWNRKQFWVTKEAASAAHIYSKKVVASESLTGWQNWQQGPTDFKQLIDIAFCEGLNQVVFHNFAHNPGGAGKPGFAYHAGEHINVNTTWWPMARPFMDYISRCSYLLRQGNFVGDVCLYYGDQAPNLVPPDRIDPNIKPLYSDDYCLHCGQPKPVNPGKLPGYDYDYMNADVIVNQLKVQNNKLLLPSGQTYNIMLIPDKDEISLEVLKKLDTLVYNGAIIIGRKPQRSTSLKNYPDSDREVTSIANKMWGNCDGKIILSSKYGKGTVYWGKTVKQVLDELHIVPDMEVIGVNNSDEHIDYLHRRTQSREIYFVSNSKPEKEKVTCVFRVDQNMVPELWDAETGLIQRKLLYSKVKNGISIDFILDPLASRFVVFEKKSIGKNDPDLAYDLQFGFDQKNNVPVIHEPINISNNWTVKFDTAMGGPESFHLDSLVSWTSIANDGIKYYSGEAKYEKDFVVPQNALAKGTEAFVVFDDIQETGKVYINGMDCGIIWTLPYKANITKYLRAGTNHITVEVINTWNNRIVGDLRNPDKKQFTRTNIKYKFKPENPLLKSGLIGKAKIIFFKQAE